MLLHTPLYLLFLTLVVLIYRVLKSHTQRRNFLLASSYIFYALFDWRFALILCSFSITIYYLGNQISKKNHPQAYAWLSVLVSLSLLGLFKYLNFFLDSLKSIFYVFHIDLFLPGLEFLLPIGLSFYTFQAISYTTEIYRQRLSPANNIYDFALYLAFFPKLIAGPLARPSDFFTQLAKNSSTLSKIDFQIALKLILLGLIKKVIISDTLASHADIAFRAATLSTLGGQHFSSALYIQGFLLYPFQIYADFSGYTDLALGSAILLGFSLPENFKQPYLSTTITSFWNSWHMSLTAWFREYLFFPISRGWLKKSRHLHARRIQIASTMITMLLIGIWHGANWTYILWGVWHGLLLTIEQSIKPKPAVGWKAVAQGILIFTLVAIGWVLFGSSSLAAAYQYYIGILRFEQIYWLGLLIPSILATAGISFAIDLIVSGKMPSLTRHNLIKDSIIIAFIVALIGIQILIWAHGDASKPFIYGRF